MLCRFSFLLFLCSVSVVNCTLDIPKYGARSTGFLSIFDRTKPFVLLSTVKGAQLLIGNETCFNNDSSVYSPSEKNIFFMKASEQDNYLFWIQSRSDLICTKNLFFSDWNNAIRVDMKDECRMLQQRLRYGVEMTYVSLSLSRHVIYVINREGLIEVVTLREPTCSYVVHPARPEYVANNLADFHVTNFGPEEEDFILLLVNKTNEVHVLNMGGVLQYHHPLPKTDTLQFIRSNMAKDVFIAVTRGPQVIVHRYAGGLKKNQPETFYEEANAGIIYLSVTTRLALIHTNSSLTVHRLVLRPIGNSTDTEVWYTCKNPAGLNDAHLVDTREKPVVKDICKDPTKPNICHVPTIELCFQNQTLHFYLPLRLNNTTVSKEIDHKMIIAIVLAVFSLFITFLSQMMPSY